MGRRHHACNPPFPAGCDKLGCYHKVTEWRHPSVGVRTSSDLSGPIYRYYVHRQLAANLWTVGFTHPHIDLDDHALAYPDNSCRKLYRDRPYGRDCHNAISTAFGTNTHGYSRALLGHPCSGRKCHCDINNHPCIQSAIIQRQPYGARRRQGQPLTIDILVGRGGGRARMPAMAKVVTMCGLTPVLSKTTARH